MFMHWELWYDPGAFWVEIVWMKVYYMYLTHSTRQQNP